MFEILKSVERSYSLGSTLILLATIWAGLAVLSYKNKRTINFYIELVFTGILYLISFVLLISAVFYLERASAISRFELSTSKLCWLRAICDPRF